MVYFKFGSTWGKLIPKSRIGVPTPVIAKGAWALRAQTKLAASARKSDVQARAHVRQVEVLPEFYPAIPAGIQTAAG